MLALLAAAASALAVGLFGTRWLIGVLRRHGIGQPIHEAVTQHAAKAGTPTMGGLVISAGLLVGYTAGMVALRRWPSKTGLVLATSVLAGGVVGALDDFLKVRSGRNTQGLRERQKTLLLLVVSIGFVAETLTKNGPACTSPAFARCGQLVSFGRGGWALYAIAVIWLTANSVNFADGLDGLLAGASISPLALLAAVAFWEYRHPAIYHVANALEISLVLAAMATACAGLLWWSAAPAAVFMGETGSLAIGCGLALGALSLHVELLIPIFGALFVAEGLSSLSQRLYFKATRRLTGTPRRLFRMAPLHHHFEFRDWAEATITIRFWVISGLASAAAGAIFYSDALAHLH